MNLYLEGPGEEEDESITDVPPKKIVLAFTTTYSQGAAASWQEDSLVGPFPGGGVPELQWVHRATLSLPSLAVGTYAFGSGDTADGLTVEMFGRVKGGPYNNSIILPDSLKISGFIRVEKAFTKNSGKFSYRIQAQYLSGQISRFSGTGTFKGFTYSEDCTM